MSTTVPRRANGSSCPVCLEDLGPDADDALFVHRTQRDVSQASKKQLLCEHSIASKDRIVVAPCSHAVHWSCYASAVRAKTFQAGRCLMCRKAGDLGAKVSCSAIWRCSFVVCFRLPLGPTSLSQDYFVISKDALADENAFQMLGFAFSHLK